MSTPKEQYDIHLLERAALVTHKIMSAFPEGVTSDPLDDALWNPVRMLAFENLVMDLCRLNSQVIAENIKLRQENSLLKLAATAKSE